MAGVFSIGNVETDLEKGVVEGGSKKITPDVVLTQRELFWDKLTTFVVSVLFGLATLNLFTQLLPRDTGIACDFSAHGENLSEATIDYILGLCSRDLPPLNFFASGYCCPRSVDCWATFRLEVYLQQSV